MVKTIYGTCNNVDIIFTNEDGAWRCTVPSSPLNKYVVALYAEDYAGNVSYFATIKFIYDQISMKFKIEIVDIGDNFTLDDVLELFSGTAVKNRFIMEEVSSVCDMIDLHYRVTTEKVTKSIVDKLNIYSFMSEVDYDFQDESWFTRLSSTPISLDVNYEIIKCEVFKSD